MPNHKPKYPSDHLTVGDHIRGLPLLKHLSQSQQMLIQLSPSWQSWCSHCLSPAIAGQASLSHFDNGKLVICCTNAAVATQIKHLQERLIKHFHQDGLHAVAAIGVRLQHHSRSTVNDQLTRQSSSSQDTGNHKPVASHNSLESIRQCRKSINNDQLSRALSRLEKTLRKR
ncbi:MAG: DUF721 domain-containing protein [Arenicella sp.]|nr:DUF721 domain-containing protein [Arenicella sp.]